MTDPDPRDDTSADYAQFEEATEQLCQLCTWLNEQRFEDLLPKAHV